MAKVAVRLSSAIPNCVFHVDAGSGVYVDAGLTPATDGETMQQWNDLSGSNHHLTGAPVYRSVGFNSQPGVEFSDWTQMASPSFLDATFDQATTLFVIGENTATSLRMAVSANGLSIGELGEWCRFDMAGLTGDPAAWYHGAQTASGNIRCAGVSYDGTTLRTIINGHLIERAYTGYLGLSGTLNVGNYAAPFTHWWNGCIAEAYVYRHGANAVQMRAACSALLAKWSVSAPSPRRIVCYVGDSQTAYAGATMWPQLVATTMGHVNQSHTIVAQGGVDLAYINSIAAGWVDPVCDTTATLNVNVVWAGTNDLAQGVSGADVYSRLATYCNARRLAGWNKIAVMTALPRSNDGCYPGHEALRQSFNSLVRANYTDIADALIDVAADGRIGDDGDELDTTYYTTDRVHLNSAGQAVIATIAAPIIGGLI